jgi:hypothetical protein
MQHMALFATKMGHSLLPIVVESLQLQIQGATAWAGNGSQSTTLRLLDVQLFAKSWNIYSVATVATKRSRKLFLGVSWSHP